MSNFTYECFDDPRKVTGRLVEGLQEFFKIRRVSATVGEDQLASDIEHNGPIIVAYDHTDTVVSYGRFAPPEPDGRAEFRVETLTMSSAMRPEVYRDRSNAVETAVVSLARVTAEKMGWTIVLPQVS